MMMIKRFLLVCLALWTVSARNSRLVVHIPHSLYREYDHIMALFGQPHRDGSLTQYVYYADSDLCDANVDTRGGYPERNADWDGKMKPWQSPYILMVDRGGCTFVQKVRNAQRSGAAGVVIADNTCLCTDSECTSSNNGACETAEPILADDGSGADISIPSFLMFKRDADAVKAELTSNRPVQIEMAWSLPSPDDRVVYNLFATPNDPVSQTFLLEFKTVAKALGDRAYFTPHAPISNGTLFHCQGHDGENYCYKLCTNNGRYCASNDFSHGISGADVVKESLRRWCIWKHYGEQDGVGSVWWDYVREFMERCSWHDYFANDDCVKDAYKHAKVEGVVIERCIQDSGGLEKDSPNAVLDFELNNQFQFGATSFPSIYINAVLLDAPLTISNVFSAICNAFSPKKIPDVCKICSQDSDPVSCIHEKHHKKHHKKMWNIPEEMWILVLVIVTSLVVGPLTFVVWGPIHLVRQQHPPGEFELLVESDNPNSSSNIAAPTVTPANPSSSSPDTVDPISPSAGSTVGS